MLEIFNENLSKIIFESYSVDPKYIDKEFQGSFNKVDLFISSKFSNKSLSEMFISNNFIKLLFDKLNINEIKKETNVIIYITSHSLVYARINLSNSWKKT